MFRNQISTEIVIEATPAGGLGRPHGPRPLRRVEPGVRRDPGRVEVGERLDVTFAKGDGRGMTMHPTVTVAVPERGVPVAGPPRPAVRVRRRAPVRDPRGRPGPGPVRPRRAVPRGPRAVPAPHDRAGHGRDVRAEQPRARRSRGGRADRRVSEPSPGSPRSSRPPARIVETDGREGLTMRALAARLGMQAPSLYKHVADKDELEALLIADALREIGDGAPRVARRARPATAGTTEGRRRVGEGLPSVGARPPAPVPARHRGRTCRGTACPRGWRPGPRRPWSRWPATGDRARAIWAFAHGMTILELDGRFPGGADLDAAWDRGVAAFA